MVWYRIVEYLANNKLLADSEGTGHSPICDTVPAYSWRDDRKRKDGKDWRRTPAICATGYPLRKLSSSVPCKLNSVALTPQANYTDRRHVSYAVELADLKRDIEAFIEWGRETHRERFSRY
jgi:hypothetical protein